MVPVHDPGRYQLGSTVLRVKWQSTEGAHRLLHPLISAWPRRGWRLSPEARSCWEGHAQGWQGCGPRPLFHEEALTTLWECEDGERHGSGPPLPSSSSVPPQDVIRKETEASGRAQGRLSRPCFMLCVPFLPYLCLSQRQNRPLQQAPSPPPVLPAQPQ